MAVLQISRIQARRGLHQDLPQLASAELGWSIDQRRLFIGNGTITEGAPSEGVTEILTQYTDILSVLRTYTFKGNAGGYTVQTGASPLSPTVRSFQDKFDDFVNIKDFGAVGDGVTDDTAAINRAISQIHLSSRLVTDPQVRRTIYFPAGVYVVSGDCILIPPYARLIGDGIESTYIRQTDLSQNCLLKFTDSFYQSGVDLGGSGATLPTAITIEHMTLETTVDKDIVVVDSASHVTFDRVEFRGPLNLPTTAASTSACVRVKSFAATTENVNFIHCKFVNHRYVINSDEAGSNIRLQSCYISGMYKGLKLGQNSVTPANTPTHYKILNCYFASVAAHAIDAYSNVVGVVSAGNHYADVGNNFAGAGTPVTPVVSLVSSGNYSVNDIYDRPDSDDAVQPRITYGSSLSATLNANVGLSMGAMSLTTGKQATLLDDQPTPVATGIILPKSGTMHYSVTRNSRIRFGTIRLVENFGTLAYIEDYLTTSSNAHGIVFTVSATRELLYTTSNLGFDADLKYSFQSI